MPDPELSLSLGAIADLAIDRRSALIRRGGEADLEATVRRLGHEGPEPYRDITVDRLAWAVAFNVSGGARPPQEKAYRGKRSYLDYWTRDTPWSHVWAVLKAPLPAESDGGPRTGLLELAASVACEHRGDWQNPAARPIDAERARHAFAALYTRHRSKVSGYCSSQFRSRAGNPEDIATEAWSRVFLDYWSADARKRVLGTSAISSLVCGTAYYIGCDLIRKQGAPAAREDGPRAGTPPQPYAPAEWAPPDQTARLAAAEIDRHVKACRERLPARQQLVARLVWDHEIRQVDLARKLGVSAPAISQLLEKARRSMQNCLREKGFSPAT